MTASSGTRKRGITTNYGKSNISVSHSTASTSWTGKCDRQNIKGVKGDQSHSGREYELSIILDNFSGVAYKRPSPSEPPQRRNPPIPLNLRLDSSLAYRHVGSPTSQARSPSTWGKPASFPHSHLRSGPTSHFHDDGPSFRSFVP